MTSRLLAILRLLSENSGYTTVEQIAESTGAGVRTIHRDLEGLERSLTLRGVRLERRRGYGIRLVDPLPRQMLDGIGTPPATGVSESGQRPLMILLYLILTADWIKLSELSHLLFVSDSTVSSDITNLEEILPDSIRVERQKGTGVRVVGEEIDARLLFLSSFPALVPPYLITGSEGATEQGGGEERLIRILKIREHRPAFQRLIGAAEEVLGLQLSPTYGGVLYCYLFLLIHRLPVIGPLTTLPACAHTVPGIYHQAASRLIESGFKELIPDVSDRKTEAAFLARILASSEISTTSSDGVEQFLEGIANEVDAIIEHSLSRLEGSGMVWLHDDRPLLNYLRLTLAAAARRIDLGLPDWREVADHPYPGIEDTPAAAALVSQFIQQLGAELDNPPPSMVRREIQEASLALEAHMDVIRSRHSSQLLVKVLCVEGLGMSRYIAALVRDIFPESTIIDSIWDPEFEARTDHTIFDLVVSSFPLSVRDTRHLLINPDASPAEIREQLKLVLEELEARTKKRPVERSTDSAKGTVTSYLPEKAQELSLPVIMSIIGGFFVESVAHDEEILARAVEALNRNGDCTESTLLKDFRRRESYGSLVFEEVNVRILHCRTDGVPEPRAGVIQTPPMEPTVLVLAAPLNATRMQTHVLSEIVIALTDFADFAEILARGDRREIQARLLSLFSQKIGR